MLANLVLLITLILPVLPYQLYLPFTAKPVAVPVESTYTTTDTPRQISAGGMTVSQIILPAVTQGELLIELNIRHIWPSNLAVRLISPDGTHYDLIVGHGNTGVGFQGTRLVNSAAQPISYCISPCSGEWRPDEPLPTTCAAGTWSLMVFNWSYYHGTLDSWSITIREE